MTLTSCGAIDTRAGKILIVDDQASNVSLLEHILASAGYTSVSSTTDPRKVCELHRQHVYDLILLDVQMPGMDGFEVMVGLKEIETQGYLPVLAITANADHKLSVLQAGARDFITKPIDVGETLMRVHNLLEVRLLHAQLREHGNRLESLALSDPLTGLANRRLLDDRLAMAIAHARRHYGVMAVLYLDLDGFKEVNDSRGHGIGDALLKAVATRLLSIVREEDTVCRLGGDEFVIALTHISSRGYATKTADKIIQALSEAYLIEGHSIQITVSIGLSSYPEHGNDAAGLLKSADAALYEAKREGKNTYRVPES